MRVVSIGNNDFFWLVVELRILDVFKTCFCFGFRHRFQTFRMSFGFQIFSGFPDSVRTLDRKKAGNVQKLITTEKKDAKDVFRTA